MMRAVLYFVCWLSIVALTCTAASPSPSGFYIVSDTPAPGSHYVDSAALPKVGHIATTPDLPITTFVSASLETCLERSTMVHKDGSSETSEEHRPCIQLELTAADAKRLAILTREHLGRRMLLVIGGEPVFAPVIRSPIDTPSLSITLPERIDIGATKAKIDELVSKPKT